MEIRERRNRACEAGYDAIQPGEYAPTDTAIDAAVVAATQVRITMDAVLEMESGETATHGLARALRALGFEVIE